jgi:hypothetical protein
MGKRIEDLPLDDTPLGQAPAPKGPSPLDPRGTEWYQFLEEIEDMLGSGSYAWARDTLEGIQETVERTTRVSEAQRKAVDNIAAGARKSRGRSAPNYFRRYK